MGTTAKKTVKKTVKKTAKKPQKTLRSKSASSISRKHRKKSATPSPSPPPTPKKTSPAKSQSPKPKYNPYRDISIVKYPNHERWFSQNIAYRRSTGTSNENFCDGRIRTNDLWVPTFGVVTEKHLDEWRTLVGLDPPLEAGYITKIGNIFRIEFLTSLSFQPNTILKQFATLSKFVQNMVTADTELVKLMEINTAYGGLVFCLLQEVFPHYYGSWTQLQISAFLGGDFWRQIPDFREYILTHDIPPTVSVKKFSRIIKRDSKFEIEIVRPSTQVHDNQFNEFMDENGALAVFMKDEYTGAYTTTEIKKLMK